MAYVSRTLRPSERNVKASLMLELFGLKWALTKKFRSYLLGSQAEVYTDSMNLGFRRHAKLEAFEQRCLAEMVMYNYEIKRKPSLVNSKVDYFSRYPFEQLGVSEDEGDVAISQLSATLVPPESTLLDSKKSVRVGATEVSLEENAPNNFFFQSQLSLGILMKG